MKAKDLKLILQNMNDDTPINLRFIEIDERGPRQFDDQNVFVYDEQGVLQITNKPYGSV